MSTGNYTQRFRKALGVGPCPTTKRRQAEFIRRRCRAPLRAEAAQDGDPYSYSMELFPIPALAGVLTQEQFVKLSLVLRTPDFMADSGAAAVLGCFGMSYQHWAIRYGVVGAVVTAVLYDYTPMIPATASWERPGRNADYKEPLILVGAPAVPPNTNFRYWPSSVLKACTRVLYDFDMVCVRAGAQVLKYVMNQPAPPSL